MTNSANETTHKLLIGAFDNQDRLNKSLREDWVVADFPYYRAVWTECGEAVSHMNWLWWKTNQYKQTESAQQIHDVHVELCDILHFGLSMAIVEAHTSPVPEHYIEHSARMYQQFFKETRQTPPEFYADIEQVAMSAMTNEEFNIEYFARACYAVGLSLPRLLTLYYAKSTLNTFRWANGYKIPKGSPGAYVKMWRQVQEHNAPRVEDNHHLMEIVHPILEKTRDEDLLDAMHTGEFQAGVAKRLQGRYETYAL